MIKAESVIGFEEEQTDETPQIAVSIPTYKEPLSLGEEFGRGVGAGVEEVKGLGAGLVGALGSAAGLEDLEEWGYTTAQERFAAASSPELSGEVNSIFDIEDAGDFVSWTARTMGKQAPQLALSVLGGGIGGIVGKKAVSSAITEALEAKTAELVGKGIAANVAKEQAQFTLAREMGEQVATKLAAEKAAQVAAMKAGVATAGSVQGVGMEVGSIYADTRDLGLAVKYGVPAGAVEGITDLYFGSKIVDALAGKRAKQGFNIAGVNSTGGNFSISAVRDPRPGVLRELGAVAGVGTALEGAQEVGQTRLEQMARAEADPNFDINSEGATRELIEAGAAGAVTGGVMGGGTTIASRLVESKIAPLTMRALQDKETGLPDGTIPADQQPEDPASLYQFDENPVTIDDGGKPFVARRFQIGTEKGWAIENPTDEEKMFYPPLPGGRVALLDGMVYGNALRHNLLNGGRLRNLGPGDSRSVEDDSDYEGYGTGSFEFPGAGTATATGDSRLDTEAENAMQSEQRRFEDQALAPYRTLKNVFNAIDAVEKAGSPEERQALLQSATDPQEFRDARYQLRAAKNQAKTPQEKQFFADLQGRLQDFKNLKEASRVLGFKSPDGQTVKSPGSYPGVEGSTPSPATPFEGASNQTKGPNPVDQATRRWAGIVEGKVQAENDLRAASELGTKTGFEAFDEYQKIQAEIAAANDLIAENKNKRGNKRASKETIAELNSQIESLTRQAQSLLERTQDGDLLLKKINEGIEESKYSKGNKGKWDELQRLEEELTAIQYEKDSLLTDEQRSDYDFSKRSNLEPAEGMKVQSRDGKSGVVTGVGVDKTVEDDLNLQGRLKTKKEKNVYVKWEDGATNKFPLSKFNQEQAYIPRSAAIEYQMGEINKSLMPSAEDRAKIEKKALAEIRKARKGQPGAAEASFVSTALNEAKTQAQSLDTNVVYTDPEKGIKAYGTLIPAPDTGKATNANGNFLFLPKGFAGLTGSQASEIDLVSGQMKPFELTPQQMVNVAADVRSDLHEATKKQAREKGVENADGNTYIQNEVALAQKKRDEEEAAEDTRRMSLEPVEVKKLREGDLVGFRLPDNERLHHTHFLSTGVKLTPTSAGKFRTAQNKDGSKQVIFDRYYVASPRGTSTENHLGKVSLPVMKQGETLVTLNELSDAEKVELGYKADESTGETISEDLWKYLYKPPTEATFASELGPKSENPRLTSNRPDTRSVATRGRGDYALYELKGDLTETEKILTLALGKFSPNPTEQDLIAAGFTPTGAQEEFEVAPRKNVLSRVFETTIPDPVSKSGLNKIPVSVGVFRDKNNPKAPVVVKAFATFDPAAVLEAKRNLEEKKNAPDSPQKNANIDIAEKSLKTAVQDLQRLTLAQMNAGLDVRVREDRNGVPITEALVEYGFGASRSGGGIKPGQYGKHIVTRVAYNPNPDFKGEGHVFTRKVKTPRMNQREAAGTLTDETWKLRGFDRPKMGLGAANEVLGNFRRQQLERAQKAKEREGESMLEGSDLTNRHAREITNLTAFTQPIFERYVTAIRRNIEESPADPAVRDRWLMEAELRLARALNGFQMKAMPESVAKDLQSQIKTLEQQAAAIEPVRGKKRVLKKGKDYGKLVDDPTQTKTQFEKQQRQWKQNLEKAKADLSDRFYRQMIPRATKGKAGVAEINKINTALSDLETSIRNQVASEKIPVQPSAEAVADAIKADKRIKDFNSSLAKAKGEPAKNRWKEKIATRKQEIEKSLISERDKTEGEVETEARDLIQKSEEHARLRKQLDRAGELTASQEGLLDSFLEYVQAEANKTDDQNRKTVTENLRRLLGRQKEAREGGRQMFINVRKEIDKVEKRSAKKQEKKKGQDAAKIIGDDETAAAENEGMIDSALKAMDFAAFTDNDKLYERAAADFAEATEGRKKALSPGDKEILKAFGKIMDEVKALKIFGTGKVPGILTQAFSAASNFKNAIEKREFYDPQTGKVVGPESEYGQRMVAGEIDPLAAARVRNPKKSSAEIDEQIKQDLARERLQELATVKIAGVGAKVDASQIELAFVKLFGGEFNGEVEGREINATYPPLEEKYSRPLFRYMSKDFGSDPGQRLAITELANAVLDDYLFNPDADGIITESQLTDNVAVTDSSKLKTPERVTVPRTRGATVKIDQKGQRVFSLAAKNQGDITQSNRDAVQTPAAPAETGGRATQQFVQEYAGLSDAEMVALGQEEIDAIYRAATSKADADLAESAMDSVIATSPSIEQLAEQDVDTLRRGLLEEVKAKQSRGDAETELRKNLRDAAKNRLFKSSNDFLNHIASQPAGINRATAMRAKAFLNLNGNGSFNWNKIGLQVSSFGKGGKAVNWAGASAVDSESRGGMALYVNLDAVHNGGLVNTVLEEMDHALTHQIINHEQYGINLNPVQKAALDRLRTAHKQAVLKAGDGMTDLKEQTAGMTPEEKVAFYSGEFMRKAAEAPEQFRPYYNLTNLDEFVVGVKQDKDFHDLLIDLGFNEKTQGGGFSLIPTLKALFTALAELVTGRRLDPNSELARVFQDSWTLSTERPANQWTVPPTKLSMALGLGAASDATGAANGMPETVRMQKDTGAFYNASLIQDAEGNWSVRGEFGVPGKKPNTTQKNKTPLDYNQAKDIFDKLVKEKSKKYSIIPDKGPDDGGSTTPPQGPAPEGPKSLAGARRVETREELRVRLNTAGSPAMQRVLSPVSEEILDEALKLSEAGFNVERTTDLNRVDFGSVDVYSTASQYPIATIMKDFRGSVQPLIAWNPALVVSPRFDGRLERAFQAVYGVTPDAGLARLLFRDSGDNYYTQRAASASTYFVSTRMFSVALSNGRGGLSTWAVGPNVNEDAVERARRIYEGESTTLPDPPDLIQIDPAYTAPSRTARRQMPPPSDLLNLNKAVGEVWNKLKDFEIFQFGRPLTPEVTSQILATEGREKLLKAIVDNIKLPPGYQLKIESFDTKPSAIFGEKTTFELSFKNLKTGKTGNIEVYTKSKDIMSIHSVGANRHGGKEMYQAAYDYILATGATSVSDSLTSINKYRRTSNMLASALRHGTTKHLDPLHSQRLGGWVNENAATGSNEQQAAYLNNLTVLAQREMENAFEYVPKKVKQWRYNFETGDFVDANGKNLSREELDSAVQLGNPEESGAGVATIRRMVITNTALEESERLRSSEGFLGAVSGQRGPIDKVAYSLAGARTKASKLLSGKKEGTTFTGQKVTTDGWFSSDRNAPANVEGLWNKSTALKGSDISLAQQLGSLLNKQAARYEKAGTPLDQKTVQTALGDIENPYTEDQKRQIDQAILENRAEDAAVLKTEFRRANRESFRRRQAEALAKLPQDTQELIGQMRDHIDQMSRYVDETMGFEVAENFGIYLNRSYLNFGDEKTRAKWQEQVRENPKIMQDLRGFVLRQLAEHDAEAVMRRATREGRILPRAQALEEASKALTEADIAAGIERVLNYGGQGIGRIFLSGKIPGQKPMKVLDERGNVAPELQAAWGMVEDPATNYVNTALKLTALVSNDKFLQDLKDEGLKTGMLYDPMNPANISAEDSERLRVAKENALAADDTLAARSRFKPELLRTAMAKQDPVVASILEEAMDPTNIPAGYVKLSGETNKSLAPISGMYAEPILAEWMFQKFPPQGATNNTVMEVLTQLTLIPMAMKTVGSFAGQVRNYISGWQSLITAGNFRPWDADWRRDMALAHRMTFGSVFGTDAAARKATIQARKRFGELGLMDQGVTANFMQDLVGMNASNDAALQKGFLNLWNKATKFAVKAYGASDDNFKIMHYLSELGKLRRAFPGESQEVLEERAAQIARDIHQTYSDTYGAVKALKKVPFIAPFISFTSEVIRNSINLVRLARNEIREGKRTGNKELENNGWKRVASMGASWVGSFGLTALSATIAGVTPEEEDDLRRLLPDWQKNSQLFFLGKSGGKIKFIDLSFSDPSNYLKRPVIGFMTSWFQDDKTFNERVGQGVSEAVMELAKPFLSEQLFTGAIMDVARNKDASGREIVNWQDTPFNIAKGITGHIGQVFLPGLADTALRVGKGWTGVVSDSGRSYDFGIELTAAFGVRPSEVNVRQALGFRSRAFMQDYRDAASLFSRPFLSQGTKSAGDIESGYERANAAYRSTMEDFRQTYLGAIRLGIPANEVRSILKANGISDEVLSMIQSGRIQPYKASKQAITRAREAGQTPRIQEYESAYATASRNP